MVHEVPNVEGRGKRRRRDVSEDLREGSRKQRDALIKREM